MHGEVSAHAAACLLSLFCGPFCPWGAFLVLAAPYASPPLTTPAPPASRPAPRCARPRGGWSRTAQSDAALAARQRGVLARPVAQRRGGSPPAGPRLRAG